MTHHVLASLRLRGSLNRQALLLALDKILERHDVLRAAFPSIEGEPTQVLKPAKAGFALTEQEVREGSAVERIRQREAVGPFDLSSGPLIRGHLLRVSEEEHLLLITQHQIISDRWSVGVLIRELAALYGAFADGHGDPLPPPELQYTDYVNWERQQVTAEVLKDHLEFWIQNLSGAPKLMQLPTDRPRPAAPCYARDRVQLRLSSELTERLREFAEQQGVTLFVTLLSGWAVLLGHWCGQEDVVIGMRMANRRHRELEPLIGPFENTAALRFRLHGNPTIEEVLKQAMTTVLEACAHQGVPFEQVIEAHEPVRTDDPAFQVLIGLNDTPAAIVGSAELQLPGLKLSEVSIDNAKTQFDLSLSLNETEEALTGTLEYASDLFEHETIERMVACCEVLLDGMVTDIQQPLSCLPMLPAVEREKVLYGFNDTSAAYPRDRLLHQLFEEQVRRTPDSVALVHADQRLTYAELNGNANQLARYLRDRCIGPDQLVGICVERSVTMVVGLLGILKAGGAFVPLDPSYPSERLAYMLNDAEPRVLLTQERLRSALPRTAAEVIALDSVWSDIAEREEANLDPRSLDLTSRHLAYVIYTSGSTGEPKGVAAEHRGMANRIVAQERIGAFSDDDTCCQKTSIGFVDAIFEILGPLSYGRPLVLASEAEAKDVRQLASLIERENINRLVTVPSLAQALLESERATECLQGLRHWTLSGEELKEDLLRKLQGQLPKCSFINLYGSSEVAADVTWYECRTFDGVRVPIGRPIANTYIYILDRHLQPVPIGVAGEIYIGGEGVAREYLNRPKLTTERFIADPFRRDSQERLYRSGDLGRWRADGTIEYLGRNDQQVKIRGFRIELGEIEAQLARHEQVKEGAVVAREDVSGEKSLVAYVTPMDPPSAGRGPSVEGLRAHLKAVLPEYMVPSAFVILQGFPLTPNGKLDRRALPAPEREAYVNREYEEPQGEAEEILAGIWQELLRVERIGRQNNFFELGGHSLLVVQMMERLRRVGLSAEVRSIYMSPTLAGLARTLTRKAVGQFEVPPNLISPECEAITPTMLPLVDLKEEHIARIVQATPGAARNIQDIYPLAPLQEGILFHHLFNEQGGDTYVRPMLLSLSSRERLEELIAALQAVIDRHDVLRTAVLWEQLPRPVQVVHRQATLPVEEIPLDLDRDPIEQMKDRMRPGRQRLDLGQAPLIRLQVAAHAHGSQWYALLWTHHLVCDNESLEIMLAEVMAHLHGRTQTLPAPAAYRNHVAQALAHARMHDAEAFFRSKLADIREPTAPFGQLDVYGDGSRLGEARQMLEPVLAQRVRAQARRLAVSAATLFHVAWALVVAHTSGRNDVVFGSVLLGRMQGSAGAQRILGMFINTLPLRLRLQNVSAKELVQRTQRDLADLLNYDQASLAVAQRCSGIDGSAPLFTALLNYLHSAVDLESEFAGASGVAWLASQGETNYPITLSVDDQGESFVLDMKTDRCIDPHRMMGYMCTVMESLVEALEQAPQTPAIALSILPDSERHQVIDVFNATQVAYPQEKLIHELFEEQVQRTPNTIAVVYEEHSLTYAELNERANQLAWYLMAKGVQPDQLVGICIERNLEMVVGLLGILKAGGAYVPLDPAYPPERLAYILRDSAPRVLLIQERLRERLPDTAAEVISLDNDWNEIAEKCATNLDLKAPGARSHHLAYVIYTSGSTGMPKGVMVEHAGLLNYLRWALCAYAPEVGEASAVSSPLAFDATVTSLYCPLLSGRSVVLLADGQELEGLEQLLQQPRRWSLIKITPAHLQVLGQRLQSAKLPCTVGAFVIGGEALPPSTVELWRSIWPEIRLINEYGPTETVVGCSAYEIPQEWAVASSVPIGQPISNTQIYILNRYQKPVPIDVAGEIHVGGAGVARGYLNRPELTAERFLPDPFSADPHARMYKTGDVGRWRADGTIEYLGRNDHQVKVRGFRIELGEIEAQLARHAQVKGAAIVVHEDVPGEKRLVAYVTPKDPIGAGVVPSVETLRSHLKTTLPEYMVPSAFIMLERLPLTPNGKLDRRVLPTPDAGAYVSRQYEPPEGEIEEIVAGIWQELLRVERVGRQANFFELGGHSLLAMQLVVRIRSSLSIEMPVRLPFKYPTLKELSAQVDDLRQSRLLASIAGGGIDIEELLERIDSMSESKVTELVRELRREGRP